MFKLIKKSLLCCLIFIMILSSFACEKDENNNQINSDTNPAEITLVEKLMAEAQIVADFIRDEGFIYGDAKINPGINWEHLDESKAINPSEKVVSCDRLVDWILYRAGFTDQVYTQGMTVWTLGPWCEDHNFQKITSPTKLQAGDIVFVNPDANYRPAHVFMCASAHDKTGKYLRYDGGSNERLQCKKGTEQTPGKQPFLEPIGAFMYAYRPNDSKLDIKYKDSSGDVEVEELKIKFEIPKATPTIDGKIEANEYKAHYTMDDDTCESWLGSMGNNKSEIYFAWDEQGLYYAAEVFDNTPDYDNNNNPWVGSDCVQLSVNPGKLITKADGIFFTFGATRNDTLVASRQNYEDAIITKKVTGAASGHKRGNDSYIIEVLIPWDEMKIKITSGNNIDTTVFEPKNGAEISMLPCITNCNTDGVNIECAYKFKGSGFTAPYFVPGVLVD